MTQLAPGDFMLEGGVRVAEWSADAPENAAWADVLKSDFWTHVAAMVEAQRVARHHLITVTHKGEQFVGQVKVLAAGSGTLTVEECWVKEFARNKAKADFEGFEISWKGPQRKWEVVRKQDGEVVKKGLATREAGEEWLASYKRQFKA